MGTVINPHGWKWPEDIDSAKPSKYSTTKWDIFPGQNSMGSDFIVLEKKNYITEVNHLFGCV